MEQKYEAGLAVMRAQPLHIGHIKLINRMLDECKKVIILLGSVQEQGTERNPYPYVLRKKMIQTVYKDNPQITVLGMFDINNPSQWAEFVLDFLQESLPDHPRPEVYYAGSEYDAQWFRKVFKHIVIENRIDYKFPYVSGSMVRDMIKIGDKRWKNFVPQEIHAMIEEYKPSQKGVI